MNLLYRFPLENGLMDTCNELGVQVLAYSPLCLGFLTGKYRKGGDLPSGPRGKLAEKLFESDGFEGLLQTMEDVAQKSGGKDTTLSQVALNWCRAKGSIPIPGARTVKQASQNIGCLSWKLSNDDLMALDEAASRVPAYIEPDKSPFAKKDINTGMIMFDS
uniref:NADP-dependent oxidoreductase domain-containing protein n=2 Tax=Corethron hystrix TaxID=216773 RepID=A0A7S1C044_9STRA|mmetsp:Transcript_8866/g.19526  ORF Transcript_8866/g.19526 Transcript_8866/m.19526 type:complete len:161 (+) Transcript_8866:1003-1485(+)